MFKSYIIILQSSKIWESDFIAFVSGGKRIKLLQEDSGVTGLLSSSENSLMIPTGSFLHFVV